MSIGNLSRPCSEPHGPSLPLWVRRRTSNQPLIENAPRWVRCIRLPRPNSEGKRRRSAMPYGMCQPSQKPVWNKESLSPGNYGRTGEPTHCQFWAVSLCLIRISLSPSLAKPADDYSFRPLMSDRENKRIIKHHSFVFTAEPCPRFLRIAFSPTLNWMP